MTAAPGRRARLDAVLLGLAVLATSLPFVGRPFHMDDDIYLAQAELIRHDPWRPMAGTRRLLGESMPTYHFTQHPPGIAYVLAGIEWLTGRRDPVPLHTAFVLFPLAAAFAAWRLARRFTAHPLAAALLWVWTPAFVVASHGLMTDVAFVGAVLGATAATVEGVDRRRPGLLVVAGLAVAAACCLQYRGALLVALLPSYAWLRGRRDGPGLVGVGVRVGGPAVLTLAAWSIWNLAEHGVVHLLDAGTWLEFEPGRIAGDAVAYVSFLGGASVFPGLLVWLARGRLHSPGRWLGATALVVAATAGVASGYPPLQRAGFALAFACGVLGLWAALPGSGHDPAQRADESFLLLMAGVPLVSQVALNLFASVRSLLVALPFLVLLWVRRAERTGSPHVGRLLAGSAAVSVVVAVALGVADFRFARASRDLALGLGGRAGAGRAWVTGEWGFRHYAERAGLTPLLADGSEVASGDLVVLPEVSVPAELPEALTRRFELEDTLASEDRFPLKLMSFSAHAGFYSNFHGALPWSVSDAPLESARLYRVR